MPKMKSHSGAKKRFRVTANGRVKRAQQGKNHEKTHYEIASRRIP